MKKAEAAKLVAMLRAYFPRQEFPPESIAVYASEIAVLPANVAAAAIKRLARTVKFLPTVAEILEAAAEEGLQVPSVNDAVRMVERVASSYTWGASTLDYVDEVRKNPEVSKALDASGGLGVFVDKGADAFRWAYERERAQAIKDAQRNADKLGALLEHRERQQIAMRPASEEYGPAEDGPPNVEAQKGVQSIVSALAGNMGVKAVARGVKA